MDSAHEKLLKEFEAFEVDQVLKEVKEWSLDDDRDIREFGEALLEERRKRSLVVKATQAARHTYVQQHWNPGCYPQFTTEWFIEGLDYCCPYWRYEFKRPLTPHQHRGPLLMPRIKRIKRPARRPPPNDDSPDELTTTMDTTSDDSEDSPDELAQLRAKEDQRRARRRVVNARYRARHPQRVAAQRQSYRARHPEPSRRPETTVSGQPSRARSRPETTLSGQASRASRCPETTVSGQET